MDRLESKLDEQQIRLLKKLTQGLRGISCFGIAKDFPTSVYLITENGTLEFMSESMELRDKFECFPIQVSESEDYQGDIKPLSSWGNQNIVSLMIRTEGLFAEDPKTLSSVGNRPLVQKVLPPDWIDDTKLLARCDLVAGVCIRNLEGESLLIYSDTYPFSMKIAIGEELVKGILPTYDLVDLEMW